MKDLFFPDALRAAAEFVIILDQHRFGAIAFLILASLAAAVVLVRRRTKPKQRKLRIFKMPNSRS